MSDSVIPQLGKGYRQFRPVNVQKLQQKSKVNFTVYTKNWFIWESCPYIQQMIRKGQRFSHSYADDYRRYVLNHLQPFFGAIRLQDIGVPIIEDFIVHMPKQQYSSSTINNAFSTHSIILNEAVRQGLLEKNPAKHVKCVAKRSAEKDLIPLNTAHELFDYRNLDLYWKGSLLHYLFNLIAFTTIHGIVNIA